MTEPQPSRDLVGARERMRDEPGPKDSPARATIAKRLGMDLTTVAHHLALPDLPAPPAAALKSGRWAAPRTLHELVSEEMR